MDLRQNFLWMPIAVLPLYSEHRRMQNAKYEKYCRLRASAQPRIPAYREAGWETSDDENSYSNACRLERRPGIKDRIEYLSKQQEDLIAEKRRTSAVPVG
jgi:hypothetical protein